MQFLERNKIRFDLYRYKLENFDNFDSLTSALKTSSVSFICSFYGRDEFEEIRPCLLGNYIFHRRHDDKVFLFSKNNYYRPFKIIQFPPIPKISIDEVPFPCYEEKNLGKQRCTIHKMDKKVKIIDDFNVRVNNDYPDIVNDIKNLSCDSLVCEGRIGKFRKGKNKNRPFIAIGDVFFLNGRDYSQESFSYRRHLCYCIEGFTDRVFINRQRYIKDKTELDHGYVRNPDSKYYPGCYYKIISTKGVINNGNR